MATPPGRRPIHAYLEEPTADAFRALCRRKGPTQTAAVQALVDALVAAENGGHAFIQLETFWEAARGIAADRRARGET